MKWGHTRQNSKIKANFAKIKEAGEESLAVVAGKAGNSLKFYEHWSVLVETVQIRPRSAHISNFNVFPERLFLDLLFLVIAGGKNHLNLSVKFRQNLHKTVDDLFPSIYSEHKSPRSPGSPQLPPRTWFVLAVLASVSSLELTVRVSGQWCRIPGIPVRM